MLRSSEFSLRRITAADGELVLQWRNSDRVRQAMYTDRAIGAAEHAVWLEQAVSGNACDYNIFEYRGRPIGLAGVSAIDPADLRCTWGYYLGVENAPAGSGRAMAWSMLERVFSVLGMRKVCGESFAFNVRSAKLHEAMGFQREGTLVAHRLKNGAYQDVIVYSLFNDGWHEHRAQIGRKIFGGDVE